MNEQSHTDLGSAGPEQHLSRDRCRDLLHGLLSAEEQDTLLAHAAECGRCENLLQEMVSERERLRAITPAWADQPERAGQGFGAVLARLAADLAAAFWQPRYRYATALTAVAAVLVLILWPHPNGAPDEMALPWLPATASDIRLRDGAQAIADEDLASGLAAYAARDLETAIARFAEAELSGQLETIRRVYLGNALAKNGDYQRAIGLLRSIAVDPLPDPWRSETLWTLYVALQATGQAGSADSLLECLAREPLEIGERARRQLQTRGR